MAERKYTCDDLAYWYIRGQEDERHRAAAAQAELHASWRVVGGMALFEQRRGRAELFRERAVVLAESMGRTYRDYRGGPVNFETGQPVRELVAA